MEDSGPTAPPNDTSSPSPRDGHVAVDAEVAGQLVLHCFADLPESAALLRVRDGVAAAADGAATLAAGARSTSDAALEPAAMTTIDRRIWWVVGLVVLAVVLWLLFDHLLFPTLPVPAGAPPITR